MTDKPPPKGPDRKRWIVDQLQGGAKQVDLAARTGLTRQAISLVWKRFQAEGESFLQKSGRRPKETDTISATEKREFVDWLRTHPPAETGEKGDQWNLYGVKRAIRRRLGKSVKVSVASDLFWTAFPEGPPVRPAIPVDFDSEHREDPDPPPAAESEASAPATGEEPGLPSIEEMERMNREAMAGKAPAYHPDTGGKVGIRTGKHSKGKKNPRPKPKRRKKKR